MKNQISNFKLLSIGYWLLAIGLFLYSYTQVDLNLTLSQWSIWQVIQKSFQYIGWFERPLSTAIYSVILFLLFTFYFLLLRMVKKDKMDERQFWKLLLPISVILLFSYNAFSYDLFNYMFDARIVTFHHENPYIHKALDYPDDPWTGFMRWTHRTYPYGPVWLGLTIPLSFVGFQFFLPTLFLFKSLIVGSFVGTVYFIGRILEKTDPKDKLYGMAIFAFNPLIIIESLVSGHHDIVMIFFLLWAIYLILSNKYFRGFLLFVLSISIKFATGLAAPVLVWVVLARLQKRTINWNTIFLACGFLMTFAVVLASIRTELQPWYLVWALPFVALLPQKRWLMIGVSILSIGLLLHYVPFLYTGNWDPPIPTIKLWITVLSVLIGILIGAYFSYQNASRR